MGYSFRDNSQYSRIWGRQKIDTFEEKPVEIEAFPIPIRLPRKALERIAQNYSKPAKIGLNH
jgi:hypothetical protein